MHPHYDVIIVGAGPAGSVAAFKIADAGYNVLIIDRYDFPRDKSCGDGLTRTSARLLYDLGLLESFSSYHKISGVRVIVENEGTREITYPAYLEEPGHGLVVPRFELDNILLGKAIERGAFFRGKKLFEKLLLSDSGMVAGIQLSDGEQYYSDIVIGADGASSKIAYELSLASTPKTRLGFGLRGYYKNISRLDDKLEIYLPVLSSSDKHILPSYGWVFPVSNDTANIGVGLIEKKTSDNINNIMERFVEKLKNKQDRFSGMQLKGKLFGAPMRFDFKPGNTFYPGLLLAGDAAGMISPFTGEGIGYAIETGIIASELFLKIKSSPYPDFSNLSEYGKILASKYQGYFETGINSVNRYQLVWKVLKGTFKNDKPLFKAIRQATIFPEGIGESFFKYYTEDTSGFINNYKGELKTDLLAVTENIINLTRKEWPFLSRLFTASGVTPGIPFRPALFLLLSGYNTGNTEKFQTGRNLLIEMGTAIELGFIASICHDSVIENIQTVKGSINWGNMFSILVGDYLLSKSYEITSTLEAEYTAVISDAISSSNQGMVLLKDMAESSAGSIPVDEFLRINYLKNKYTFELCLKAGSMARGAGMAEIKVMEEFGKYFGTAYFIGEDTLSYVKKIKGISEEENMLYSRDSRLSLISLLLNSKQGFTPSECIKYCGSIINNEIKKAIQNIESIKNDAIKNSLTGLCRFVQYKTSGLIA